MMTQVEEDNIFLGSKLAYLVLGDYPLKCFIQTHLVCCVLHQLKMQGAKCIAPETNTYYKSIIFKKNQVHGIFFS